MSSQILGLSGHDGIAPAAEKLNDYIDQYGSLAPLARPTLLWLNSSDAALKTLTALGLAASVSLLIGLMPGASALLCWLIYLSFKNVASYFLGFQWDDMLLESGLLTVFLAPWTLTDPILNVKNSCEGRSNYSYKNAIALFLLRWMLFRVMFCSGMVKLFGGCSLWQDFSALEHYWETQLLPNQIAWHLFTMPKYFQKIGVALTFLMELLFPFFIFARRPLRLAAALGLMLLQLAMFCSGNHGFINILTATLCIPLLDDLFLAKIFPEKITKRFVLPDSDENTRTKQQDQLALAVKACCLIGTSIVMFITICPKTTVADLLKPATNLFVKGYHLTGFYGLYPIVNTERLELVVEGSNDSQNWQPYEFKYHIGALDKPPPTVLLQQPRLDWRMRFAALGSLSNNFWLKSFVQRLLQGSQPVLALLENNPFKDKPPKYIRVQLYNYQFTTINERQKTGNWWRRQFIANYLPATEVALPGVRSINFAGSWYPADATALQSLLDDLEKRASLRSEPDFARAVNQQASSDSSLIALLVPHAAYRYSGIAAMEAYDEAKKRAPKNLKRVILLGPLHKVYGLELKGALLPAVGSFATPLGDLPVDVATINTLAHMPNFAVNENAHDVEHSLEMQLPLIHHTFKNISIVPILIPNNNDKSSLASISKGLRAILKDGDLIIASGDMTHWGKMYGYVPFTENVRANVQKLDEAGFEHMVKGDTDAYAEFEHRTKEDMCCFNPLLILMQLLPTNYESRVIDYYTSQDAMPKPLGSESERCVGYLSASFSKGVTTNKKPAETH